MAMALFWGGILLLWWKYRKEISVESITNFVPGNIVAYLLTAATMILTGVVPAVWVSFLIVTAIVCLRLYQSKEEKEPIGVKLLWMR